MTWVLDLDGVVWLAEVPIAGSVEAVARLQAAGRVVFLTNNSSLTVDAYVSKFEGMGIRAVADDVITSAQAAASLVSPGQRVLVCAGEGVVEAVTARQAIVVEDGDAELVVVGWHRHFDFDRLKVATRAVLGGARLIGTNDDPTYPSPDGLLPGGGALLAAVAYASGVTPVVAGKPHEPMAALVRERVGPVDVLVGDRAATDGQMARVLGARFAFVRTGVDADPPVDLVADVVAADLNAAVAALLDD